MTKILACKIARSNHRLSAVIADKYASNTFIWVHFVILLSKEPVWKHCFVVF